MGPVRGPRFPRDGRQSTHERAIAPEELIGEAHQTRVRHGTATNGQYLPHALAVFSGGQGRCAAGA
jgi:hypothetical protein